MNREKVSEKIKDALERVRVDSTQRDFEMAMERVTATVKEYGVSTAEYLEEASKYPEGIQEYVARNYSATGLHEDEMKKLQELADAGRLKRPLEEYSTSALKEELRRRKKQRNGKHEL